MSTFPRDPIPVESYNVISEKNIFSPERKEFPAPAAAIAEVPKPIIPAQVVLYGVVIAGDYQSAIVSIPDRPHGKGERGTQVIKSGEKIGEYTLAKILPDRICMESNGAIFEVLLYDPQNPKRKVDRKTEIQTAMAPTPQISLIPLSVEAPVAIPAQESAEKPKEPMRRQFASLPYNKYTYQVLGPSGAANRGKIVYSVPAPSAQ